MCNSVSASYRACTPLGCSSSHPRSWHPCCSARDRRTPHKAALPARSHRARHMWTPARPCTHRRRRRNGMDTWMIRRSRERTRRLRKPSPRHTHWRTCTRRLLVGSCRTHTPDRSHIPSRSRRGTDHSSRRRQRTCLGYIPPNPYSLRVKCTLERGPPIRLARRTASPCTPFRARTLRRRDIAPRTPVRCTHSPRGRKPGLCTATAWLGSRSCSRNHRSRSTPWHRSSSVLRRSRSRSKTPRRRRSPRAGCARNDPNSRRSACEFPFGRSEALLLTGGIHNSCQPTMVVKIRGGGGERGRTFTAGTDERVARAKPQRAGRRGVSGRFESSQPIGCIAHPRRNTPRNSEAPHPPLQPPCQSWWC